LRVGGTLGLSTAPHNLGLHWRTVVVTPWIVNNYKSRNPHALVKLFWHSIGSDAQEKSFQRMSRRQDSRWISVMVNDVLPLELGHILEVNTIARRRPIEFERICEPSQARRLWPQIRRLSRDKVRTHRNMVFSVSYLESSKVVADIESPAVFLEV
jgi:mannosyltransferase OCH1-like enzyme